MVIVAIKSNGEVIREAKLPISQRALEDYFGIFNGPIQAVVECTSSWYWLSAGTRAKDSGGAHRHKSGNKDGNRYLRAASQACWPQPISPPRHFGAMPAGNPSVINDTGRQLKV